MKYFPFFSCFCEGVVGRGKMLELLEFLVGWDHSRIYFFCLSLVVLINKDPFLLVEVGNCKLKSGY